MDNERLVRCEESTKQAHKRVDTLEHKVENIYDLTLSVKELASETKAMREDMSKIDNRVHAIEEKPSKNWDKIMNVIITRYSDSCTGLFFREVGIIKRKKVIIWI